MASELQEQWQSKINQVQYVLPKDLLTSRRVRIVFDSMKLDGLLCKDMTSKKELAWKVGLALGELKQKPCKENYTALEEALNAYYLDRRDDAVWEKNRLKHYSTKPLYPIFILSYGRPERNGTLTCLERLNSEAIFKVTKVFVEPDQVEEYKKYHPKWTYVAKHANTVGERCKYVLDYCAEHNIRYCSIMEDEIVKFNFLKKGGIDYHSKSSVMAEEPSDEYLRLWQNMGIEIMHKDPDAVIIGIRNRVCSHTEATITIGYQSPMRGGAPNLLFFVDVEKFKPIYDTIPPEHYSPQYDWAFQCATVAAKKRWYIITAIVKEEDFGSKSVIGYTGDRTKLAEDMLKYYGVEDKFRIFKVKSEAGSIKLQYKGDFYD